VSVNVDSGDAQDWDLDPADREQVVRIAREAIINAVRHGKAEHIEVHLGSAQSGLLLRVSDDGCGIDDPAAAAQSSGTGLGMGAMRAGARVLGGRLVAQAGPDGGTQLEVVVS
jgi:signal transduction histidine kinase